MRVWRLIALIAAGLVLTPAARAEDETDLKLKSIVAGAQRSPPNVARDGYRHPYEVLRFFGLKDNQTVIEILPGGALAYWTEILGPYLRENGKYVAAVFAEENTNPETRVLNPALKKKLADNPELYDKVTLVPFGGDRHELGPANSADVVLTFRNLHNWMSHREEEAVLRVFYRVLKPGGILGIEEHRGRNDQPQDPLAKSGYVRTDYAIALFEKVGFQFIGSSEINANPRDTKDYPQGVWTLPPSYRLGDVDRAKYQEIGESDRFVLKFVKPGR